MYVFECGKTRVKTENDELTLIFREFFPAFHTRRHIILTWRFFENEQSKLTFCQRGIIRLVGRQFPHCNFTAKRCKSMDVFKLHPVKIERKIREHRNIWHKICPLKKCLSTISCKKCPSTLKKDTFLYFLFDNCTNFFHLLYK